MPFSNRTAGALVLTFLSTTLAIAQLPPHSPNSGTSGDTPKHQYSTLAHEIVRLELQDPKLIEERLTVLDRVIGYVLQALDEQAHLIPPGGEDPEIFFAAVNDTLNLENFIVPPTMDVQLLTDALAPHKLSKLQLRNALEFAANSSGRLLFEQAQEANADFYLFDCDTGSLIYLAVAELKRYPCYMVEVPDHNFIRWASRQNEVNWDPITKKSRLDTFYRRRTGMPPNSPESDCLPFLKSMTRNQILAYWHSLVAGRRTNEKHYREAEDLYEKGYALNPKSLRIGNNWAWFMATCPDPSFRNGPKAVSLIKPLVECWPNPEFLDTLAAAYAESGDFKAAVQTEGSALELSNTWTTDEPPLVDPGLPRNSTTILKTVTRDLPYNCPQADMTERIDAYAKGHTYANLVARKAPAPKPETPTAQPPLAH